MMIEDQKNLVPRWLRYACNYSLTDIEAIDIRMNKNDRFFLNRNYFKILELRFQANSDKFSYSSS